ncbi:MAG: hypothetical protein K0S00_4067 [Xanthobacteraceae bacterium]|jgi:hypothetical protein|nr:hypothetical protein [Xanthobacteraceae bacterium]
MSRREIALAALKATLAAALTGADVKRNAAVPQEAGPGGLVILRDGDPGEPEVSLSPPLYAYEHRVDAEIYAEAATEAQALAILNAILDDIDTALTADRTLGGTVDYCEPTAPTTDTDTLEGSAPMLAARLGITLIYTTTSPLG